MPLATRGNSAAHVVGIEAVHLPGEAGRQAVATEAVAEHRQAEHAAHQRREREQRRVDHRSGPEVQRDRAARPGDAHRLAHQGQSVAAVTVLQRDVAEHDVGDAVADGERSPVGHFDRP